MSRSTLLGRLSAAVRANDPAAIERALEAGDSVDTVDFDGRTALHLAVATNAVDAARALLDHGADPNAVDRFGLGPLFRAVFDDRVALVELLRSRGAEVLFRGGLTVPPAVIHARFSDLVGQLHDATELELEDTVAM